MNAKANVKIIINGDSRVYSVELYDVDLLIDDLLVSKTVKETCNLELFFNLNDSGEFRAELQLRIFDENRNELYRSPINNSLSSLAYDKNTGRIENTTIDFGVINL